MCSSFQHCMLGFLMMCVAGILSGWLCGAFSAASEWVPGCFLFKSYFHFLFQDVLSTISHVTMTEAIENEGQGRVRSKINAGLKSSVKAGVLPHGVLPRLLLVEYCGRGTPLWWSSLLYSVHTYRFKGWVQILLSLA